MTAQQQPPTPSPLGPLARYEQEVIDPHHRLQRPPPGMAAPVLRTARHLLPGPGGRRRGHDGPSLPGHDQPHRRRRRPGADGHGHHLVHGQDLRRPPQPGRQHRLRPAPRLPLAARPRLHRRPAGRGHARRPVPPRRDQRVGQVRVQLPRPRLLRHGRLLDGAHPDHGPGQRHPRHRLGRPERRHHRRLRRRRLHRPGRPCGAAPSRAPR